MNDKHVRVGIGVFVVKDGTFLLQRRKGSHGEGTWSIPGGHLEFGESFEQTAEREIYEETGVSIKNVRFAAVTNDIINDDKHYVSVWLLSDYADGEVRIMEPGKCDALEWRTLDSLPEPLAPWWDQLFVSDFVESIRKQIDATKTI